MILTDAGPLVAILDRTERRHGQCRAALSSLRGPMLTTWPAFTEAMYLLGRGGWPAQALLWRLVLGGQLQLAGPEETPVERMAALMERYQDHPMDLSDASLVALAEARGLRQIFTLDQDDFQTYRLHGRGRLQIVP